MALYDAALGAFVKAFGEDAVEAALDNYRNQRERSKKASAKSNAERQMIRTLLSKAKADPKLAEILRQHNVAP